MQQHAPPLASTRALSSAANSSSEESTTSFVTAALDQLDFRPSLVKSILHPDREFTANLAVQMDNGEVSVQLFRFQTNIHVADLLYCQHGQRQHCSGR